MNSNEYRLPVTKNALIIILQLVSIAACFYALTIAESWWQLLFLAVIFAVVMNSVYSVIHEAHHRILFPNERINDAFGIVMSLFFPAAFHLLRQGHISHHMHNRSDDEAFDLYFDKQDKFWKMIVWYGILTGVYWMLVVASNFALIFYPKLVSASNYKFHRTFEAFLETYNPKYLKFMRLEALAAVMLHVLIVLALGVPFWKYFLMYYAFGLSWSSMQYVHHYATEREVLEGARNLWLWGVLDKIWLNHNLHRSHHKHPRVPWTYLPEVSKGEGEKVEFLPKYYFAMWRGPRYTEERVENKYLGKIVN